MIARVQNGFSVFLMFSSFSRRKTGFGGPRASQNGLQWVLASFPEEGARPGTRGHETSGHVLPVALEEAVDEFSLGVDAEMAVDDFDVVSESMRGNTHLRRDDLMA